MQQILINRFENASSIKISVFQLPEKVSNSLNSFTFKDTNQFSYFKISIFVNR